MLPWWLYALTPRDQTSQALRIFNRFNEQLVVSTLLTSVFNVPAEFVAILLHWSCNMRGGVGQNPIMAVLNIFLPTDLTTPLFQSVNQMLNAPGGSTIGGQGIPLNGVLAPPGARIQIDSSYTAGGVANFHDASIGGVLIPRGTIQIL